MNQQKHNQLLDRLFSGNQFQGFASILKDDLNAYRVPAPEVIETFRALVFDMTKDLFDLSNDEIEGGCLYVSHVAAGVLEAIGVQNVMVQAGTMNWPMVTADYARQNPKEDSHFSFEWCDCPNCNLKAMMMLRRGGLPEIHLWVAVVNVKDMGSSILIDLLTEFLPSRAKTVLKKEWRAPLPPAYLFHQYSTLAEGDLRPDVGGLPVKFDPDEGAIRTTEVVGKFIRNHAKKTTLTCLEGFEEVSATTKAGEIKAPIAPSPDGVTAPAFIIGGIKPHGNAKN